MATDKVITIQSVSIERFQITIEGDSPLLCHKFSSTARSAILDKQMGKKSQRAPKDPEQDFKECIYQAKEGWYGFPASGIKQACVGACRFVPDLPMTEARGAFFVISRGLDVESGQQLVMLDGEPEMHESMVRIGRGVADVRFRAQFFPWSMTFDVRYNPNVITDEAIVSLLQLAGFHQGVGDWRPEKNGTFGMFQVKGG
jgi:hypothetical protein